MTSHYFSMILLSSGMQSTCQHAKNMQTLLSWPLSKSERDRKQKPSSMLLASDVFLTSFHCELRCSLSVDESLLKVLADWLGLGVLNS